MSDFVISNVDSAFIKVDCDKGFGKELSDFFTFTVPGHRYMPAFRKKIWDGKIKLFNYYKREIYAGLEDYVVQFARDRIIRLRGKDHIQRINSLLRLLESTQRVYSPVQEDKS